MKVCFVSFEYPPRNVGGAGTYAGLLVEGFKKRGVDTYTITRGEKHDFDQKIYRVTVPNTAYWRRLFFNNKVLRLVDNLNRKHHFDVVHFNEPHIVTRSPKLPMVCTFHSTQLHELQISLQGRSFRNPESFRDLLVKNPLGYLWDIVTCHLSDRIIGPCPDLVNLLRYCFIDKDKVCIIPNGIDPEIFDNIDCDDAFLDRYTLEKDNFVLYMGRLYSLKGIHYLIKAFQNLKKRHKLLKLVIAGKGEFEPYLRKIAQGTNDIIFIGYVDSIMVKKALYENCLTVVVPSMYETFPMVVLEAMVCSKPVIASNVGGIRLMVKDGRNGFLVKPGDTKGIETSIRRLCEDPELSRKMGNIGRRLVEEEFSVDEMVNSTLKVYESLLESV
jgi:glycosyltransferase involved in cell wall biosynthesis